MTTDIQFKSKCSFECARCMGEHKKETILCATRALRSWIATPSMLNGLGLKVVASLLEVIERGEKHVVQISQLFNSETRALTFSTAGKIQLLNLETTKQLLASYLEESETIMRCLMGQRVVETEKLMRLNVKMGVMQQVIEYGITNPYGGAMSLLKEKVRSKLIIMLKADHFSRLKEDIEKIGSREFLVEDMKSFTMKMKQYVQLTQRQVIKYVLKVLREFLEIVIKQELDQFSKLLIERGLRRDIVDEVIKITNTQVRQDIAKVALLLPTGGKAQLNDEIKRIKLEIIRRILEVVKEPLGMIEELSKILEAEQIKTRIQKINLQLKKVDVLEWKPPIVEDAIEILRREERFQLIIEKKTKVVAMIVM